MDSLVSIPARRRMYLAVSLVANFGLLGYFKYGTFLLENFLALVRSLGWDLTLAAPSIILPVGISFYTFQTLSYTLDVYRRKTTPAGSFLDYALYVTFFPQLVAGPIIRAVDFLPQCRRPKSFSRPGHRLGTVPDAPGPLREDGRRGRPVGPHRRGRL